MHLIATKPIRADGETMNHKPTRDLLGEPAYYSERDLFVALARNGALVILILVAVVVWAIFCEV
jgi:hypothetical protein